MSKVKVNHPIPENVKRHAGSSLEDTLLLLDIVKENNMKQQKQKKVQMRISNPMSCLILRRNLSGTWRWSRRCRNKRRRLWSCPGTPKLALMGFEQNNKVNHLWRFDFFASVIASFYSFLIILICQMLLCAKRAVSQNTAFPVVQEVDAECEVVYFHFLSPETWSQLCFCWTGQYMLC